MDKDFQKAKEEYNKGQYTLVICKDADIVTSDITGIKPLINLIEEKKEYKGYSAADKVVGKAAAFLYTLLGVKNLYGKVMCKAAVEILKKEGINYEYTILTEFIQNRTKNGICPIEEAVQNCTNAEDAREAIREKTKFLQSQKH